MDLGLKGKRVLVTGAGRGIGRAVAVKLNELGAIVYALSKTKATLQQLNIEIPSITCIECDIGDPTSIQPCLTPHLPFDLLVNNAGIGELTKFIDLDWREFDRIQSVNVRGTLIVSQVVVRSMLQNSIKGSIVNVSSQASTIPLQLHTAYCMSKASMDAMCRNMALELGSSGIRVNCINPTVVMTDMGIKAWSDPDKAKPMLNRIPLNRFAEVSEVVNGILFLLSSMSSMTTGSNLPIDGGATSI